MGAKHQTDISPAGEVMRGGRRTVPFTYLNHFQSRRPVNPAFVTAFPHRGFHSASGKADSVEMQTECLINKGLFACIS